MRRSSRSPISLIAGPRQVEVCRLSRTGTAGSACAHGDTMRILSRLPSLAALAALAVAVQAGPAHPRDQLRERQLSRRLPVGHGPIDQNLSMPLGPPGGPGAPTDSLLGGPGPIGNSNPQIGLLTTPENPPTATGIAQNDRPRPSNSLEGSSNPPGPAGSPGSLIGIQSNMPGPVGSSDSLGGISNTIGPAGLLDPVNGISNIPGPASPSNSPNGISSTPGPASSSNSPNGISSTPGPAGPSGSLNGISSTPGPSGPASALNGIDSTVPGVTKPSPPGIGGARADGAGLIFAASVSLWDAGPSVQPDVPITAVFLILFLAGATVHGRRCYRINKKMRDHTRPVLSALVLSFCLLRVLTCVFRIVLANLPGNAAATILEMMSVQTG